MKYILSIPSLCTVLFELDHPRFCQFLIAEYGLYLQKSNQCNVKPNITVKSSSSISVAPIKSVKEPVGCNGELTYWYDKKGSRVFIENIDPTNTDGIILSVDKDFDIHFLLIIVEYCIGLILSVKGSCLCHASAVQYKDQIFLFPAWRHAGKTNLMLYFVNNLGAKYIADDWIILTSSGKIIPLPKRIHVLYHNIKSFPVLLNEVDTPSRQLYKFCDYISLPEYGHASDQLQDAIRKKVRFRIFHESDSKLPNNNHLNFNLSDSKIFILQRSFSDLPSINSLDKSSSVLAINSILSFEQHHLMVAIDHISRYQECSSFTWNDYSQRTHDVLESAFNHVNNINILNMPKYQTNQLGMLANTILNYE